MLKTHLPYIYMKWLVSALTVPEKGKIAEQLSFPCAQKFTLICILHAEGLFLS